MDSLDFLWLELTSRCNLQCVHCYADSAPNPTIPNTLTDHDYLSLIDSAAQLGCRAIQFIGGEPTLVPFLPDLIRHSRAKEYSFVEVYTNATHVSEALLECFVKSRVAIAVSFYSDDPAIHDAITGRQGSHRATVRTLQRLVKANLTIRAGIIEMPLNQSRSKATVDFLHDLGIASVRCDRMRAIGRGSGDAPHEPQIMELCGNCWQGSLAVGPDGTVAPCIMSKEWAIGAFPAQSLSEIAHSADLVEIRQRIREEVWLRHAAKASSQSNCNPDCAPWICNPKCTPVCSPSCSPCFPFDKCQPQLTPSC